MTSIAVAHPKGGVGRSTTVYFLGLELARQHPDWRIILEDHDQGQHLSRMYELYPPDLDNLALTNAEGFTGEEGHINLVDTAPEASVQALRRILMHSQWLLVPVKGPEAGSVQVLPSFLHWIKDMDSCQLIGFVPTMWKPRRAEAQRWLRELHALASTHASRVFPPIPDLASIAAWSNNKRPYADLARAIVDATTQEGPARA